MAAGDIIHARVPIDLDAYGTEDRCYDISIIIISPIIGYALFKKEKT